MIPHCQANMGCSSQIISSTTPALSWNMTAMLSQLIASTSLASTERVTSLVQNSAAILANPCLVFLGRCLTTCHIVDLLISFPGHGACLFVHLFSPWTSLLPLISEVWDVDLLSARVSHISAHSSLRCLFPGMAFNPGNRAPSSCSSLLYLDFKSKV